MKIETTISARHFYIVIGIVYFIKKYLLECSTFLINKSLQPTCPLRGSSHLRIACNKISRLRLIKREIVLFTFQETSCSSRPLPCSHSSTRRCCRRYSHCCYYCCSFGKTSKSNNYIFFLSAS